MVKRLNKKDTWAFLIQEGGIEGKCRKEALEKVKQRLDFLSKLSIDELQDEISMWDEN